MGEKLEPAWPRDLKIFALLAGAWAVGLAARVLAFQFADYDVLGPLQAVLAGIKFYGGAARVVLIGQAAIFAMIAVGIGTQRSWGLVLGVIYMTQVVVSHLVFVIAYMDSLTEAPHVRTAALTGPIAVLILLYLWIRTRELVVSKR